MKTVAAILITGALIAAGLIISALVGFDILWLIIGATSLWAAYDSSRLQVSRYKVLMAARPVGILAICGLLWIFTFPLYLITRQRIKGEEVDLKSEIGGGFVRRLFRRMSKAAHVTAEFLLVIVYGLKWLLVLFLLEECWRGAQMWQQVQQDLKARGEPIEFKDLIPPPVRDVDNFFSAPKMSEWFVIPSNQKRKPSELATRLNSPNPGQDTLIGELTLNLHGAAAYPGPNQVVLRVDDPKSNQLLTGLIQSIAGPCALGAGSNCVFITRPLNTNQIRPVNVVLDTDKRPAIQDLLKFLNNRENGYPITVKTSGSNTYHLYANFYQASAYLKWSDRFDKEFALISEAVKRPYARMDSDYSNPTNLPPIPNFHTYRAVCTVLTQRAQCYLLLGQPEKALQQLALVDDLRRSLQAAPSGKTMTLVAAMINVAIAGLETSVISDGFRLHAWQDSHIAALQKRLEAINLTPCLADSFRQERAFILAVAQKAMNSKFESHVPPNATLRQKVKAVRPSNILRGVFDINMVKVVELEQMILESVDATNGIVKPQKVAEFWDEDQKLASHPYPYGVLVAISVPNYTRAAETLAFNQDKAYEAEIVCAIERYRLANGAYPPSLSELVPQFIAKLPHDIIGGGKFKYSLDDNDHFTLYSIGWNEKDDGGRVAPASPEHGDWVWQ